MSQGKMLLLATISVLGALPIFLLVASGARLSLGTARRRALRGLQEWVGKTRWRVRRWITLTVAFSLGFVLLMALSHSFNELGDACLPSVSPLVAHFGKPSTAWSSERYGDWKRFRDDFRSRWAVIGIDAGRPESGGSWDREMWVRWGREHGLNQVRVSRSLVGYALLVVLAGALDLRSPRFRRRGAVLLVVGALSVTSLFYAWADRKDHYVNEVFAANRALGDGAARVPESWALYH